MQRFSAKCQGFHALLLSPDLMNFLWNLNFFTHEFVSFLIITAGGGGPSGLSKALSMGSILKRKKKKEERPLPENLKPKPVIKPKASMRNLHWTKVSPYDVEQTIWNDIDEATVKFNKKELETKFCWKQIEKSENDTKPEKPKNETVRVLDTRRSYNIEVSTIYQKMKRIFFCEHFGISSHCCKSSK